jgi:hypothetical protein
VPLVPAQTLVILNGEEVVKRRDLARVYLQGVLAAQAAQLALFGCSSAVVGYSNLILCHMD